MTLGGITGLQDCLLLPPVRVKVEDGMGREHMLFTCLRILAQANTRPMGICVDNLEQCFQQIGRTLQAAYPAQVVLASGDDWPPGDIVVHLKKKQARGILLGEDPLHVYKRLLDSLNFRSREAAFAARSLQCLLGSWNPTWRLRGQQEIRIGQKLPEDLSWVHFSQWEMTRAPALQDVLAAYFGGFAFPPAAADVLLQCLKDTWTHPGTKKPVPSCCKVVIYRELARACKHSVKDCAPKLFSEPLTVLEIQQEMDMIGDFFQDSVFAGTRGGAQGLWFAQQLRYLKHFRQRPVQVLESC